MYVGDYKILCTICKTESSCLYAVENCSVTGSKDELPYVLKEMNLDETGTSTLEYKKRYLRISKTLWKKALLFLR